MYWKKGEVFESATFFLSLLVQTQPSVPGWWAWPVTAPSSLVSHFGFCFLVLMVSCGSLTWGCVRLCACVCKCVCASESERECQQRASACCWRNNQVQIPHIAVCVDKTHTHTQGEAVVSSLSSLLLLELDGSSTLLHSQEPR